MEPIKTIITQGKYTFQITDNTLSLRDQIYSRNFKIGGNYPDCVNVSITYQNNLPVSASIPHVVYDPECSIHTPLDRGQGSVIMIKTLLQYIHTQIPTLTEVRFEDKSSIECATEQEIETKGSRFRKKGTYIYPIPLYYFSLAFNGETWYEKHFHARQSDTTKHQKYKETVHALLYSQEQKSNTSFLQFLQIAQPPIEIIQELESYYTNTKTFGDFFQSIPKLDRCKLVREWIYPFMSYHLKDVFDNTDWIIELPVNMNGGGKRSTRKSQKYYCPRGRIRHNKTYKDFGIRATDI
jgi:hypothetical protein